MVSVQYLSTFVDSRHELHILLDLQVKVLYQLCNRDVAHKVGVHALARQVQCDHAKSDLGREGEGEGGRGVRRVSQWNAMHCLRLLCTVSYAPW